MGRQSGRPTKPGAEPGKLAEREIKMSDYCTKCNSEIIPTDANPYALFFTNCQVCDDSELCQGWNGRSVTTQIYGDRVGIVVDTIHSGGGLKAFVEIPGIRGRWHAVATLKRI